MFAGLVATDVERYITPFIIVALLALDITALMLGRRERRERLDHMARVEDAARVYSRAEYEFLILKNTQIASKCIYCYWHSLNVAAASSRYQAFNRQLIGSRAKQVDVRIITAKETRRLAAAHELRAGNIEVRFQDTLLVSDLRFTLIDDRTLVFGLAEADEKSPSREGIDILNHKLAALLLRHFREQWDKATTYEDYLGSVVAQILNDDSANSVEMIAKQLRLPVAEVQRWDPQLRLVEDEQGEVG